MKAFEGTRASLRKLAWRMAYAGRIKEHTSYSWSEAFEQAAQAQDIDVLPDWKTTHPQELADRNIRLFCPPDKLTPWGKRNDNQG